MKPTHTDQYLQWDSHHHLSTKFSVIQTLSHRASTVCSNPELLQKEKDHLRKALTKCKYPKWALDKVEKRVNRSSRQVNDRGTNNAQSVNHEVQNKGHIVIPYTQGLCESIKKISGRYGIQTYFKGGRTIKNLLVSPKDKDPMVNQSGAIYWYCSPSPRFWHRYVDDTFVIHKEANKQGFLQHINSVDPAIRFTVEDNKEDGSIPFLDTIVKQGVNCHNLHTRSL